MKKFSLLLICTTFLLLTAACSTSPGDISAVYRGTVGNDASGTRLVRLEISSDGDSITGYGQIFYHESLTTRGPISGSWSTPGEAATFTLTSSTTNETVSFDVTLQDGELLSGTYAVMGSGSSLVKNAVLPTTGNLYSLKTTDELQGSFTLYDGLLVRRTLNDTGEVPYALAAAALSPDIVVQSSPMADPSNLTNAGSYATDPGQDVVSGSINYVYVRVKNTSTMVRSGTVSLYAVPSSLVQNPGAWGQYQLMTAEGDDSVTVYAAPDSAGVTSEPFFMIAQSLPANEFYTLVAVISTPDNPGNIPSVYSLIDLARWLETSPNVAMRSVKTVALSSTTSTFNVPYGNLSGPSTSASIGLNISGLAVGSSVSFSGASAAASPQVSLASTSITTSPQLVAVNSSFPSNFSDTLTVNYSANSTTPTAGALLSASQYIYQSSTSGSFSAVPTMLVGQVNLRFE